MRVIYMAHPVSGDVENNLKKARSMVRKLEERNPDVAIVASWITECEVWDESDPEQRKAGLKRDLAVISKCDELWLTGTHVSTGMEVERKHAVSLGIPVLDFTSSIPDFSTEASMRELLRRAIIRVGEKSIVPIPRWVYVMDMFGHGSGYSHAICREFGADPDELIGGDDDGHCPECGLCQSCGAQNGTEHNEQCEMDERYQACPVAMVPGLFAGKEIR